ncbi:VOC family protein [Rhodobacter ferrooxidans]|uniref:Glyoxalase/bleomycin resistance protein/dioxygenase n=1 Tax=Rhodobacter ferrooxidans TaxID=371731 RepID=C8S069_9RHOB|nr:VOC family protein [Rhodobacter sp. SW2]EEW25678.1 Glyoxalase/bleomycin resistance protein/dioxygenase [Rhodobacter sp. SW2]
MIRYITLGTNDLPRAIRFYDAALAPLGLCRLVTEAGEAGYGPPGGMARLWITRPFDGKPATAGNGSMPALTAPSRAAVDDFHAAGLAQGGFDEGAPGLRPYGPDFYAAYLRDPDGNKLSAVCGAA